MRTSTCLHASPYPTLTRGGFFNAEETNMAAVDEVKAFLREEGYELEEGHIMGKSTGGAVRAEAMKNAINNYEMWHVIVHKLDNPKSPSVKRIVERPLRQGLRFQWGDQ